MPRLIRRHWRLGMLPLVLLVIGSLIGQQAFWGRSARARSESAQAEQPAGLPDSGLPGGAAPGNGAPASAQTLDPFTYSRVSAIRDRLALTNQDLAAMGCSGEQAAGALSALKQWCQSNAASLKAAESARSLAQQRVHELKGKINVGPADAGVKASLVQARQELAAAERQYAELLNSSAVSAVSTHLSGSQQTVWNVARVNVSAGVLSRWRYVPNVSDAQKSDKGIARSVRSGELAMRQAEERLLEAGQRQAMASAASAQAAGMLQVLEAERSTLPIPPELLGLVRTTSSNR